MPTLTIRECTDHDLELIRSLGAPGTVMERHRQRFGAQEGGACKFLIAWSEQQPVGSVTVLFRSKYDTVRLQAGEFPEMNALEATPRGQGIGTAIIHHAEEVARSRGAEKMGLAVEPTNAGARRLYERLGYAQWDGGVVVDRWSELDDEGTPTVEHADECLYLIKVL